MKGKLSNDGAIVEWTGAPVPTACMAALTVRWFDVEAKASTELESLNRASQGWLRGPPPILAG